MSGTRWRALVAEKDDAWGALIQKRTQRMVTNTHCDHRHKTREAALKCARKLAEDQGVIQLTA